MSVDASIASFAAILLFVCLATIVLILATVRPKHTLDWYRKNEGYCSYCGATMYTRTTKDADNTSLVLWTCHNEPPEGMRNNHDLVVVSAKAPFDRRTGLRTDL